MSKSKTHKSGSVTAVQASAASVEAASREQPGSALAPRQGSKKALVVGLLMRSEGASLADLIGATGWLPHTTRAALSGLRKRGFAIDRTGEGGPSVYRIAAPEPEPQPEPKRRPGRRRLTEGDAVQSRA